MNNEPDPQTLSNMLSLDTGSKSLWGKDDLRAMLVHQLDSPLEVDLVTHDKGAGQTLMEVRSTTKKPPETFRELFLHPHPPIGLLEWVKEFGKAQRRGEEALIPEELAAFLYFISIAVARLRCEEAISTLSDKQIAEGVKWLLAQEWLDEEMRALCQEAQEAFGV